MTLDEIAIVRAEYETDSLKIVRKDGNPPSNLKWSYPLRAKAKRSTLASKPSRSRRTSAFSKIGKLGPNRPPANGALLKKRKPPGVSI